MKSLREYRESSTPAALVNKLFEARQVIHVLHLRSKSYSEHVALNDFYDGILGLVDEFVEVYQGEHGILDHGGSLPVDQNADPVKYLDELADMVKKARTGFEASPHLQNIIDEMLSLTYRTLYKLKFLK